MLDLCKYCSILAPTVYVKWHFIIYEVHTICLDHYINDNKNIVES